MQERSKPALNISSSGLGDFSYKPPVRVPFAARFDQIVGEGLAAKGVFGRLMIADKDGEIKELNMTIEYDFMPETVNSKGEVERAKVSLRFQGVVTDLVATDKDVK